jgi:beta-glucosidase
MNEQYLDPILLGNYPELLPQIFGQAWPKWPAEDLQLISQPIDFVGVNYYTRSVTHHDPNAWPLLASRVKQPGATYTETDWEVFPQGLIDTLVWVADRYGKIPLYVTENGAAFHDPPVSPDGRINDVHRTAYFREHLKALHDAIARGVDVRGYFAWSLLDNLEWSLGFSKRFGIVHVDFKTQARTPKTSARFYSEVIESNGRALAHRQRVRRNS